SVAGEIVGEDKVNTAMAPVMGAEDFSYMLQARPGAFIFVGNGDSAGLHHPAYDFNDEVIPIGTSYWARLVETPLPGGGAARSPPGSPPAGRAAGWSRRRGAARARRAARGAAPGRARESACAGEAGHPARTRSC